MVTIFHGNLVRLLIMQE